MTWLSYFSNLFSPFFLNPAFVLPGLALISAPIVIHLINRMRYRRVRFAAMEFLLQSQQRNRRKLLLEQLLLLLLRVFAILALVALIARPFLDPSQLLILQGERAHHLVVLDDSGSMRGRAGEATAFDAGVEVVRKIAEAGARQPGTQALTLMLLSNPEQPVINQQVMDPEFLKELEDRLENLEAKRAKLDWVTGLEAAQAQLKNPAASKNLHLVSDFRYRDWGAETAAGAVVKSLEAEGVKVNLIRAVPDDQQNLGVTDLTGNAHVAAANIPVRLTLTLQNFSQVTAEGVRLSILQDGKKLPLSLVVDKIEPGAEVSRDFDIVFPSAGKHEVQVVLPPDALDSDNSRFLAFDIAEANPVLIITGDIGGEPPLLADALAPDTGITGFAPLVESVDFLRRQSLEPYQCIFMLDVPELPPDALRALEDYVEAGGGLAWFMGAQARPAFYNDKLYKGGAGLFPGKLNVITELFVDDTNPAPDLDLSDHPVFRAFQGQDNPFIDRVRVTRYFSLEKGWAPSPRERIIGRVRNGAPLFLEHQYGKGRVFTCLTTAGNEWNTWPENPSFVLFQLELEKFIARNDRSLERRVVGEPIEISLDPATYRSQLEIRSPNGAGVTRLATTLQDAPGEEAEDDSGDSPLLDTGKRLRGTFSDTDVPGVYTVIRYRQDDAPDTQLIAYNVPVEEGELTLATNDQIRTRLGNNVDVRIQEFGTFDWIQNKQAGQEVRDLILLALLLVLLIEQALAMRLSYHPKTAGAAA